MKGWDMKTVCRIEGEVTSFVITELDLAYHDTVRSLYYSPVKDGFSKSFPSDTPHLDRIFVNFERYCEEMILQMVGAHPVPWDKALKYFLRIAKGQNINWWLTGSAALAVRGIDITPHDIDLIVDDTNAVKLGELLQDYVIEPVVPTVGWIANRFGRAFRHARLEWVGGVHDDVDKPYVRDFGPAAANRLEVVNWRGETIRVPPLQLQLQENQRRGLVGRVEKIERHLGKYQSLGKNGESQ